MKGKTFIWVLVSSLLLAGCNLVQREPEIDQEKDVSLSVGMAVEGYSFPATKAYVDKVTELATTPVFRGISEVRVMPFFTGQGIAVTASKQANGYARTMPSISKDNIDNASHSIFYNGVDANLPTGTTAVLAYGRANRAEVSEGAAAWEEKHINGSLLEEGFNWQETYHYSSDILFLPDGIYNDNKTDVDEAAQELADILTEVTSYTFKRNYQYQKGTYPESGSIELSLKDTGSEFSSEFQTFSGQPSSGNAKPFSSAGNSISYRLQFLKSQLQAHTVATATAAATYYHENSENYRILDGEFTWGDLYDGLRSGLIDKIDEVLATLSGNKTLTDFPGSFGLPAGSALVKWNGSKFVPVPEGMDGYIPIGQFCYMPSLYYYSNSTLRGTYDTDVTGQVGSKDWTQVISDLFQKKDESDVKNYTQIVTRDVKVVALETPLNYACAQLLVKLAITSANGILIDHGSLEFDLDGGSTIFPVTGMIVSGQYAQNFDFTPVLDANPEGNYPEYYLYDNHINNLTETGAQGIYLSRKAGQTMKTLVLPSPLSKAEAYFYLEFKNDSGKSFAGAEGTIPDGSYFYLAGKIAPTETDLQNGFERIFEADKIAVVNCSVASLANAYLSVPRVGNPQLALGIETKTNWYFSPSSYLILE